jgi:hypothetical protein
MVIADQERKRLKKPSDHGQLVENVELVKLSCLIRFVCLIVCCCLSSCLIVQTTKRRCSDMLFATSAHCETISIWLSALSVCPMIIFF